MTFDINRFIDRKERFVQYQRQIDRIKRSEKDTVSIEGTVSDAERNLDNGADSFIIYGDPQSGKTEMMIALTAKLLDKGNKIIVILLNDNVGLLEQNLRRFSEAGIDPDPKNYTEILDEIYQIKDSNWVIFCKKNASDLRKLIRKIGEFDKIIIDDEADYASPNGRINRGDKTEINRLIGKLFEKGKKYIGVTATPARLDLNNTFENANDRWVKFLPHRDYVGYNDFFPSDLSIDSLKYQLKFLPAHSDEPKFLIEALFRFLINVAYLNQNENIEKEKAYSMLIHTSSKTVDHSRDHNVIVNAINILKDTSNRKYESYVRQIYDLANKKYDATTANNITSYILNNINRSAVLVINSKRDQANLDKASNPKTLFTIAIGGNIISRGVTFVNLLSMFFTRTVRTRMQQDTYIQRARMFGLRRHYLKYFELTIPEQLYADWHRCFVFHRLALESAKNGNPPVWIEDRRIRSVAAASIDRTTVQMSSGEISCEIFVLTQEIETNFSRDLPPLERLSSLRNELGDGVLPLHIINFISQDSPDGNHSIAIHKPTCISGYTDANQDNISRRRGFIGDADLEKGKFPHAIHHIKVFYNAQRKARIFYKFLGISGTNFLKNLGRNRP
jgi:hypothetical protein